MVSEALIPMQVSESLVTIPAKWPGILNFLFGSKRISHRGIDEVCVCLCRTLPSSLCIEYGSKMGNGPVSWVAPLKRRY